MGMQNGKQYVCVPSPLVVSDSVQPYGRQPARLLCPWHSPGKDAGLGCCALPQGVFLTRGSNLHPLCLPALAGRLFTTGATWEDLENNMSEPLEKLKLDLPYNPAIPFLFIYFK